MQLLNLFISILLAVFFGWNLLSLIRLGKKGSSVIEDLSLSYGIGLGSLSLEMLVLYLLRAHFNILNMIVPWAIVIVVNAALLFRARASHAAINDFPGNASPSGGQGHKLLRSFLFFGVTFEVAYAFFRALIKPMESYDAVAIYAIKSKIFFLAKAIPEDFFTRLAPIFPHADYPLNLPLAETFIYTCLGQLNDQLVKIIFPLYFVCILVVIYFAIARIASRTYALLFTFILASVPQFNAYAANAYLEVPLAFYCFASALFLFEWLADTKKGSSLIISAVMAGLAGWTKNEGLMYCGLNVFLIPIFFIFDRRGISVKHAVSLFFYCAIIFLILAPWLWIKSSCHLVNSDIGRISINPAGIFKELYKLKPIAYEFQKHLFGPKKWNILWIIVLVAFIFNCRRAFAGPRKYITIYIGLVVAGYIFFYMISPLDIAYFLSKTWSRFLLHFLPIVIYWLAVILKEEVKL